MWFNADEWLGVPLSGAFELFRSRIAASIRSIPLSLDLGRKANIMKAIMMTPTPEGSKLAWEPRFQAMFQLAEAYVETYISAEAARALSAKLLQQWNEGRVFIHSAVQTALLSAPLPIFGGLLPGVVGCLRRDKFWYGREKTLRMKVERVREEKILRPVL